MATFALLKSGRYQARIRRRGRVASKTFRTKALAKEWAKRVEDEIDRGSYGLPADYGKRKTIGDILTKYSKEMTPRKKSWKVETYIMRRLADEFAWIGTGDFTADRVIAYVDKRRSDGIGPATITKDLNKLSHALDTAVALKWCQPFPNPVKTAKHILSVTTTLKQPEGRERRLRPDEGDILLASRIGDFVEFALETAMRRGEIARVKLDHMVGNTLRIAETKTGKSRLIPLSDRAIQILEANPDGFGFAARTLSKIFAQVCRDAGISDLRVHDLRHEAASRMFEKGLSIEEVALITGHSDWRSLKRYTHLKAADIAKKL